MATRACFHLVASGFGIAFNGEKVRRVLDWDGIAGQEFQGDRFELDTGDSFVQLFDCDWRFVWGNCVVWRKEKDSAETPRTQRGCRGEERNRRESGNEEGIRLAAGRVSFDFSVFVLSDAR